VKRRAITIVGAGIGGLTLARFLAADGHRVTLIERASDFSAQGHSIGFRGVGFQVMELLGLRARVEQTGRHYRATRTYTMAGEQLRTVMSRDHAQAVGGIAVTQRGLLHAALHEGLPPEIEVRFGVKPIGLKEEGDEVVVALSDGTSLRSDLLVGADGANSTVRRLAMPDTESVDCGGVYVGMTIKTDHGLMVQEVAAYFGVARIVSFLPIDRQSVSVVIYQDDSYEAVPVENSPGAWAPYLKRAFADAAEPVRRILPSLQLGDDIYHDRIRQVPPKRVVSGRIALIGDAGYCPTFFSGNGSALAAVGAYCLAKWLRTSEDDRAVLEEYQKRILPFAAGYQTNATRLRNTLFTHSGWKIALRHLALRYTPEFIYARGTRRHYRGEARLSEVM
jgi:2-polyprenyl-6-methoxyphenol hydroxylase-like FAD-dependent oxidoreductase